jgi:hypothetical protein
MVARCIRMARGQCADDQRPATVAIHLRRVPLDPSVAIRLWEAGFATAGAIQLLAPRLFADSTRWEHDPGWQLEIAIWNIGTVVLVDGVRRRPESETALLRAFTLYSTLFGTNHLIGALRSPRSPGHWLGTGANAAGLAVAVAALRRER